MKLYQTATVWQTTIYMGAILGKGRGSPAPTFMGWENPSLLSHFNGPDKF